MESSLCSTGGPAWPLLTIAFIVPLLKEGTAPNQAFIFASCRYSSRCEKQVKWALQTAVYTFTISGVILPLMNGESCLYAVGFWFKETHTLMSAPLGP